MTDPLLRLGDEVESFVGPDSPDLPRQRLTAGVLFRDEKGRVLLVEPSYRPDWLTPGGSVEALESPVCAAAREVHEELGLSRPVGRMLVVQWCHVPGEAEGVLHFTYDGGVLDEGTIDRIELEAGLVSFRFVEEAALNGFASTETTARVSAALQALDSGSVAELGR